MNMNETICRVPAFLPTDAIENAIKDAARIMLEADSHRMQIEDKAGPANFVTEYDVKVQRYLQERCAQLIPGCRFLAEEEGENENPLGDDYTFIIDPIDGTTNFMLGRRASCISVALFKDKRAVYAAVYDPYADRFYSAMPGKGAFCNKMPIHVSDRDPKRSLALIGTAPYYKETLGKAVADLLYDLLMHFGDIRRVGSAALDICSVACGEAEAFLEPILSPWDFAAGALILTEAGGIITDFHGEPLTFDRPHSLLCAGPTAYPLAKKLAQNRF